MFKIYYVKNKNNELTLENITKLQNYIPIYKQFFSLNETNYNSINLNHKYHLNKILEKKNDNSYLCQIQNENQKMTVHSFWKYSPLIDPIKYMAGKYKSIENINLPCFNQKNGFYKINDINNSAYVDSFFSFLSSQTLNLYRFYHGIDFYGSFLGIKKKFIYDIGDDVEYLRQSNFFHSNNNKKFHIESIYEDLLFNFDSRKHKKHIKFSDHVEDISCSILDQSLFDDIFKKSCDFSVLKKNHISWIKPFMTDISKTSLYLSASDQSNNKILKIDTHHNTTHSTKNSTCSSTSSHTSHGSESSQNMQNDCSDNESEFSSDYSLSTVSDDVLQATLYNFPVQIICLESLDKTLDSIMPDLDIDEWRSCLFQIIMTLLVYQKLFDFTHNDLHTNNIMFKKTDKKFLYYYYHKKYYKVPTWGKIYKIIDFGRAIYKFKNKLICSDSFHPKGDAATQYNCEPYLNKKKPRLDPNKSFDICRLGCSLYDFFFQDDNTSTSENEIPDPIPDIIAKWCKDDKGRNILYKKNGDDRYPDFKLYKMIARTVHHCPPEKEIINPFFHKFIVGRKKIQKKARIFNVDKLPSYVSL